MLLHPISGFFILLEEEIRVGDVVEIAGRCGLVERVDFRDDPGVSA